MIKGLGTDIVEISRIQESLERLGQRFADRILRPEERQDFAQSNQPERFLAKRFAVKEACAKALGTGIGRGVSWQHLLITHDDFGKPQLLISDGAQERMAQLGAECAHVYVQPKRFAKKYA